MPSDQYNAAYYNVIDDIDCDCSNADVDIMTGDANCYDCGRRWRMGSEEFSRFLAQRAEWEKSYFDEISSRASD